MPGPAPSKKNKTPTPAKKRPSAGLTRPMKDAIRRSGYLMEQRLVPVLEDRGFFCTPNAGFADPETGDAREIDIFAIDAAWYSTQHNILAGIFPVLLIQCKNLEAPLVFFTQDQIPVREIAGPPLVSGVPLEVRRHGRIDDLADVLEVEEFHHYYRTRRLASQFCAVYQRDKGQKSRWVASHELEGTGNLYRGLVLPLVKAVEAYSHEHMDSWEWDPKTETINLQFYYPIAVTTGELYECFVGGQRPRYRRVHRVQFIRRHEAKQFSGDYRIDVVTESGLGRLLDTIGREMQEMADRVKKHRCILVRAAREIAAAALSEGEISPETKQAQETDHP